MNVFNLRRNRDAAAQGSPATTAVPSANPSMDSPRANGSLGKENSGGHGKIPHVTFRTIVMATLVAMGGFIFGTIFTNSKSSLWC
jgi:hypothetical protein